MSSTNQSKEDVLINPETGRKVLSPTLTAGEQSIVAEHTKSEDQTRCEAVIRPHLVPIIFIPGIMGSNLKATSSKETSTKFNQYLWKTPRFKKQSAAQVTTLSKADAKKIIQASSEDKADKVWCVSNLGTLAASKIWRSPATRAKDLNPETTCVDYNPKLSKGPGIFDLDPDIDLAIALIRGWGSVSQDDYWPVMSALQKALNQPYHEMIAPYLKQGEQAGKTPKSASNKDGSDDVTKELTLDAAARGVGKVPLLGGLLDWNARQRGINETEALANRIWTTLHDSGANDKPPYASFNAISGGNGILGLETPAAFDNKQVEKAACYHFRVYGGGYNWLNSNAFSANTGDPKKDGSKRVKENELKNPDTDKDYTDCLSTVVDSILASIKENEDCECDKVILVTHSMGGLVARAYAARHSDKVLGVVHGVMPATGAAPMYKRMRAGFGGIETSLIDVKGLAVANVLGDDGAKVAAVLTHSVGGIELAPSDSYADPADMALTAVQLGVTQISIKIGELIKARTHQWLQVQNSAGKTILALPRNPKKVYDEIYSHQGWYGLIPIVKGVDDGDMGTDNPIGFNNKRIDPTGEFNYAHPESGVLLGDYEYFKANVAEAMKYHMAIVPNGSYHPNTYAQCMVAGLESAHQSFNRIVFTADGSEADLALLAANPDDWDLIKDTLAGKFWHDTGHYDVDELWVPPQDKSGIGYATSRPRIGGLRLQHKGTGRKITLTLQHKDPVTDWGDGTVPAVSGLAPAPYIKALFEQHDDNPDIDHQTSWKQPASQLFALYAITKIIQEDKRETD